MKITKELVVPNYGLESTQGKDGLPAIYTTVTNQNIVLNAPYQGLPSDYSKTNGSIQVFEGDNEVTEQATYTLKQTLNVAAELDFNKFKVTYVSTDNGMFIVTVTYKEFVSDIMITTNIVRNGQSGPKGDSGKDGIAGKDGVGIKNTTLNYGISTSGTTKPSNWSTTVPTVPEGQFLWTETTWTYTDNTSEKGYSVAKQGAKGQTGQQGPPTGIIESPTIPTEVYQGMLWKNTGNLSGYITDVTYIYRGSKWEKYIFTADNIYAETLSAINANLGDVIGGSFTGGKFINNYDSRYIGDSWQRGSIRIEDGVIKDKSEYYNKVTGEVTNTNSFYTLHNSLEQSSTNITTGHRQVGIFSSSGITLTDSNYTTYGPSTMVYQDFIKVPPIQLTPASSDWAVYATSGSARPTVSRNGRLIQLSGVFTNTKALGGSSTWETVCILPSWARPNVGLNYLAQGSGTYIFNVNIQPDGQLRISKYRNSSTFSNATVGSGFNVSQTFAASDF